MLALERQVCFALSVAARNVVAVYRPVLEPLGLTHPQYLVMLALWQHGPLSVKAPVRPAAARPRHAVPAAQAAGGRPECSAASATRAISGNLALALTDKGRALRAEAEKIPAGIVERLGMPVEELMALQGALDPGDRRVPAGAGRASAVPPRPAAARESRNTWCTNRWCT